MTICSIFEKRNSHSYLLHDVHKNILEKNEQDIVKIKVLCSKIN